MEARRAILLHSSAVWHPGTLLILVSFEFLDLGVVIHGRPAI
jgi:hypothetical protein